jgi:hypothetical protein
MKKLQIVDNVCKKTTLFLSNGILVMYEFTNFYYKPRSAKCFSLRRCVCRSVNDQMDFRIHLVRLNLYSVVVASVLRTP